MDILHAEPFTDTTQYPMFPEFKRKMIHLESYQTVQIESKKVWRFNVKRYQTQVIMAYGHQIPGIELLKSSRALTECNQRLQTSETEVFRLNQLIESRMATEVAKFLSTLYSKSPGACFIQSINEFAEISNDIDKKRMDRNKESSKTEEKE